MVKVVKNDCFGGFGLSGLALQRLAEITGRKVRDLDYISDEARTAPELIQVVEELGKAASCSYAELVIVEVPEDVDWYIDNYNGLEIITECHRTW